MPNESTNFESLGFDEAPIPVDWQHVPEQFARFPLPQPGAGFIFQLPPISLADNIWQRTLDDQGAPRLEVHFENGKELLIAHDPFGELTGQPFRWRVNNIERQWNVELSAVSRMVYLIKDGLHGADLTNQPNSAYARELCQHSGRQFGATVIWQTSCSKDRDIYKRNPQTGQGETVSGIKGCGQRYGLRPRTNRRTGETTIVIPKDDETGRWLEEFECRTPNCGAWLRAFGDLETFRFVEAPVEAGAGVAATS